MGEDDTTGPVTRPRLEARLDIVVDLETLLSLGGGVAAEDSSEGLRDLLADEAVGVTMRRLVTDPMTGHLLDVGRRTYEIPDRLRAFIVARDGTCRFPGCQRQASRCQIDHAEPWGEGGETSISNLGALCVRHHQLKTHGGWRIADSAADGSCTWFSPSGRRYAARTLDVGAAEQTASGGGCVRPAAVLTS